MRIGQQLGSYHLEAQIGAGGMGSVYRALDTRLNRPVAIKVLSDDIADAAGRRRFQREAQMASSLNATKPRRVCSREGNGDFRRCRREEFDRPKTLTS